MPSPLLLVRFGRLSMSREHRGGFIMVKHTMQRAIEYRTILSKENSTKSKLNKNYKEIGSKFLGIVGNPLMKSGNFWEVIL